MSEQPSLYGRVEKLELSDGADVTEDDVTVVMSEMKQLRGRHYVSHTVAPQPPVTLNAPAELRWGIIW